VLVAASFVVQLIGPRTDGPAPDTLTVELPAWDAEGPVPSRRVRVAYTDDGSGPVVVLLHGSPGSKENVSRLGARLAERFRVMAVDLPGFGASERWIPDYSIRAHARYVLGLLDALGIARAHVFGHSMGGGVGLHMADLAPERVTSLTLYGSIGLQEGEGSGSYHFEQFKYAVGYVLAVVVPEFVPHFGLLGPRASRHAFIRNFQDTDLRSMRGVLRGVTCPTLIVHGHHDPLVPVWAAWEHHRLITGSELVVLDASHFMVFTEAGSKELGGWIVPFLERVENGGPAPQQRTIDRSPRSAEPHAPLDLALSRELGPLGQIGMMILGAFASEDLTCLTVGLLVREGHVDLFVGVLGCFLAIFLGDVLLWFGGRVLGRRVLSWKRVAGHLPTATLDRLRGLLERRTGTLVFASRFMPGTRVPLYIAAGALGTAPLRFIVWLCLAALVWTPLVVVLAALVGTAIIAPMEHWFGHGWLEVLLAAVVLLLLYRIVLRLLTRRGRARLMASLSRLWRWEFWPPWVFYAPVVVYVTWLAIRYRGFATATACNPAFPMGAFIGESKYDILRALPQRWIVPSTLVLPGVPEERVDGLLRHMAGQGWSFPLILKPDTGYRGVGVKRVSTPDEVTRYVQRTPGAVLCQTYHPGPFEAGVFYYRFPAEPHGHLFSITDKHFPVIEGDGHSSLEELVWSHPRLRMQARVFLKRHAAQAERVPAAGERVPLAVAGNHCQGTLFRDGRHLITPALERRVDEISQQVEGFYFGRFDVRYRSVEEFREGNDLAIIELNGLTSESTNIYDPSRSLAWAYRTLMRQWSLAFEIGARNRRNGAPVASAGELLRAVVAYHRTRCGDPVAD
jgi:pimeloyl-ACP methyl ester carboxylesterase